MPRGPARLNAAAVLDGGGRVAAVNSIVCWDALDGIDCLARSLGARPEIVIVPIVYSSATDEATRAIVGACEREAALLEAAGLRVEADVDLRRCPGYKFNRHEERHVPARVEIGSREVAEGTVTLVDCTVSSRERQTLRSGPEVAAACRRIAGEAAAAASAAGAAAPCGKLHVEGDMCSTELRKALGVSRGGCGAPGCPRRHPTPEEARAAVGAAYPLAFGQPIVQWGTRRALRPAAAGAAAAVPQPAQGACGGAPGGKHGAEAGGEAEEAEEAGEAARGLEGEPGRGRGARRGMATLEKEASLAVLFVSGLDSEPPAPGSAVAAASSSGDARAQRSEAVAGAAVRAYNGQLRAALAPYGQVARLKFAVGIAGRLLGWAHVWLRPADPSAPDRAIADLDGKLVLGGAAVRLSHTAGRADALFPWQPFEVRAGLRIDQEASYSVADEPSAAAMASFLAALCRPALLRTQQRPEDGPAPLPLPLRVTDGAACAGGCAAALARCFARLTAVEVDASRAADLRHNLRLLLPPSADFEVLAGDYSALWRDLRQDVIFLDPPWGGAGYGEKDAIRALPLGSTSVEELAIAARGGYAAVLALRLPRNYDEEALVRAASGAGGKVAPAGSAPTLAFRADFGTCSLLALCSTAGAPAAAAAPGAAFGLSLGDLDAAMASLAAWDKARRGAHAPAFWDWDTTTWIKAARWRPAAARRPPRARPSAAGGPARPPANEGPA
eukprot:tig00000741_g3837.t1